MRVLGSRRKIDVNQNGGGPADSYIWSGSTELGTAKRAAYDCNGWVNATSTYGPFCVSE